MGSRFMPLVPEGPRGPDRDERAGAVSRERRGKPLGQGVRWEEESLADENVAVGRSAWEWSPGQTVGSLPGAR